MFKRKIALGLIVVLVMNLLLSMGVLAAEMPKIIDFKVNDSTELEDIAPKMGRGQDSRDVIALTFDQPVLGQLDKFTLKGVYLSDSTPNRMLPKIDEVEAQDSTGATVENTNTTPFTKVLIKVKELSLVSKYTLDLPKDTFTTADGSTKVDAIKRVFITGNVPNIPGRNPLTPAIDEIVTYSEPMVLKMKFNQVVTLNPDSKITIMSTDSNSVFKEILIENGDVTVDKDEVSIKVSGMKKGEGYQVKIGRQVIIANNGLDYSGISNWNFRIATDNNIGWNSQSPGPQDRNVSPTAKLKFNLHESVIAGWGNITINRVNSNSTTTILGSIPVNSSSVTGKGTSEIQVDLSSIGGLANNTTYQVVVPDGAFKNAVGNGTRAKTWSFTTIAGSTIPTPTTPTAVTLSAISPATVDTTSNARPVLKATANQAISVDIASANNGGIYLYKDGYQSNRIYVAGAATNSSYVENTNTLSFRPIQDLEQNSRYYVVIGDSVIFATASNLRYTQNSTLTFSTTTNDKTPPVLQDAIMSSNNTIRLRYNEALSSAGSLSTSSFKASVNGEDRRISNAYVSGEYVYITLDLGVAVGQVIRISYTANGTTWGRIQDLASNPAASFSSREVTNGIDSVLPKPKDGYISGRTLYLNFSESLKGLSSTNAYQQFTVTANGSTKSISSISSYSGSSSVTITLDSAVGNGEVIKVSYQPGSYPLQDFRGNNIAPFTDFFVRNSYDTIPPEFTGVSGSGNKIVLTYNEPLRTSPLPLKSQFSVLVNNAPVYVNAVEVVSNQVILTLASSFTQEQAVTISYVSGSGGTADLNGNLAGFINLQPVTYSNVSQGIQSATVSGDIITIKYNSTLRSISFLPPNQFAVMANNEQIGVQTATVSGNTVTLKLSSQITKNQTVTLSYMTGSAPLYSSAGEKLSEYSEMTVQHVTNTSNNNNSNNTTVSGQPSYLSIMTSTMFNKIGYILNISTAKTTVSQSYRGVSTNRYTIDIVQMQEAFKFITTLATNRMLVFEVPSSEKTAEVAIPLSALISVAGTENISVAVKYKESLYEIPLEGISLAEISRALTTNALNSAYLIIQLETVQRSQINMPAIINGVSVGTLLEPVEVRVVALNGNGATNSGVSVGHAGNYYLRMNGSRVTANQATLVNYNLTINLMERMLSSVTGSNGNLLFIAKVNGNATIGPVVGSIFYPDINNHWGKGDINELSSKLIVSPTSSAASMFEPNRNITRGEFGEYIAKALGLTSKTNSRSFPDVPVNTRGGYIASAVEAGIITGYPDGTFKPEQPITREQMALMMVRAMSYAKQNVALNSTAAQTLSRFKDAGKIQDKETVAKAVQAGIIQGMTPTSFQPKGNATRAQAVAMIKRVLSKINYL